MILKRFVQVSPFFFILAVLLFSGTAPSVFSADPSGAQPALAERVVEHHLKNGLTLLMVERHQAPVVSCTIAFRAGGVNEHPGITGVAHLYEHLAFKGTRTLGTTNYRKEAKVLEELDRAWRALQSEREKGDQADHNKLVVYEKRFRELLKESDQYVVSNEIAEIYQRNGGIGLNASTGKDLTRYVVSLPSNRLELWAAIESDRMAHPVLREFYKEKEVVLEERRLRYENSPSGRLYEAFVAAAFRAHPYGQPVIGWTSDLELLSRAQTEDFFRTYYGPENTVISTVGDIRVDETIRMIEKYFGPIPPGGHSPEVRIMEPDQQGERRVEVEFDAEPALIAGYHKPGMNHPDDAVFDVIDALLSEGRSSRLYTALVKEKGLAVTVSTGTGVPGAKYPHLFIIQATLRAPHTTDELEAAVDAELDRLKREPVQSRELQKVLNRIDANLVRSLESNSGLASQLSFFQAVAGDWRYLLNNREQVARVTSEDVQRVARRYFVKGNRVVATLVRKGQD